MSVVVRSLINTSQTIDSVAIGAFATQVRNASTAALVAAVAAKTVQMDVLSASYYEAPLTGVSYQLPDDCTQLYIKPAGTIAAHTLVMPVTPTEGQELCVTSTQIVTALTMTAQGGTTLQGALTAFTANGFAKWKWNAADTTWYRVG
jgi:hypothetical protein